MALVHSMVEAMSRLLLGTGTKRCPSRPLSIPKEREAEYKRFGEAPSDLIIIFLNRVVRTIFMLSTFSKYLQDCWSA